MRKNRPVRDQNRRQRERRGPSADLINRDIADFGRVVAQQCVRYDSARCINIDVKVDEVSLVYARRLIVRIGGRGYLAQEPYGHAPEAVDF